MMDNKPPWRSKKYLAWVRQQPCMRCWAEAEPHHIKGCGQFSGAGQKASDFLTMPLCHRHHMQMHEDPTEWDDQPRMILQTLDKAFREGVLK